MQVQVRGYSEPPAPPQEIHSKFGRRCDDRNRDLGSRSPAFKDLRTSAAPSSALAPACQQRRRRPRRQRRRARAARQQIEAPTARARPSASGGLVIDDPWLTAGVRTCLRARLSPSHLHSRVRPACVAVDKVGLSNTNICHRPASKIGAVV
eukprot:6201276-Pleurochrysis_carterae.AAC.2